MRRPRALLFAFFLVSTQASSQEPASPPKPSDNEKQQAQAALNTARDALFPIRHSPEVTPLLTRIAPLLAVAGNSAGAQDVLALLPQGQRDGVQLDIIAAELRNGELQLALQTATAIPAPDAQAPALLSVVHAQASAGDSTAALQTSSLISPDRIEAVQAMVEVAKAQQAAGKSSQAAQLLRRAAAAAAVLSNSDNENSACGLSALAQVANAQQSIGESADALKTLQLAGERLPEAGSGCSAGMTRFLQDDSQPDGAKEGALQKEVAQLRNRALPSAETEENETQVVQSVDESTSLEGVAIVGGSGLGFQSFVQAEPAPPAAPESISPLNSLRTLKPLDRRARAAVFVSQQLTAQGKTKEAEEAIRIGLEAADLVQDDSVRSLLLSSKASARAAANDWEGARNVIEGISEPLPRTEALGDIAFRAAAAGQAQLALPWAMAESSPFSEAAVLVAIAEALLHQPYQSRTTIYIR